jgi:GT2 family glycosyltransferase
LVALSVIIPFHGRTEYLSRCLAGLKPLPPRTEVIVVADGADEIPDLTAIPVRLIEHPGPSGPAVARNRGAAVAKGDVLVFIDSDVVASPDELTRLADTFDRHPEVAAVFGAYDDEPAEPNLISQYKNLTHSYIHRTSNKVAQTFWAGFGAVRAKMFFEVGGFDERFVRPSIEDIDLGYRLCAAGHLVWLDAELQACHLKRWTFSSLLASDVLDRGIPWTQLIWRGGRAKNDLNLKNAYRVSVGLTYILLALLLGAFAAPALLLPAGVTVLLLHWLGRDHYRYFVRHRGLVFALRIAPLHYLYHLYNGFSFLTGSTLYLVRRWFGIRLPGSLPLTPWQRRPDPKDRTTERPSALASKTALHIEVGK